MGLRDLNNIKLEYRSLSDNVVENFYIPCLSESWEYDRAVNVIKLIMLEFKSDDISADILF